MQDQIDEIMDWFDFEKVHEAMEAIGWKWHRGDIGVPSIQDLKKEARKLLRMAAEGDGPEWMAATGGFYARKSTYEGKPYLRLSFEIANWETEERVGV